jgi:hypothetical protein
MDLAVELRSDAQRGRALALESTFAEGSCRRQLDDAALIAVARRLRWFEWAWTALPMLLVLAGGGIGAIVASVALWISMGIFRSERSLRSKYALSGLVSGLAAILFVVAASALQQTVVDKR